MTDNIPLPRKYADLVLRLLAADLSDEAIECEAVIKRGLAAPPSSPGMREALAPTDAEARELVKRLRWRVSQRAIYYEGDRLLFGTAADLIDSLLSRPSREVDALNALHEIVTNGRWSEGEQYGEWCVSKEVLRLAYDADLRVRTTPTTSGE